MNKFNIRSAESADSPVIKSHCQKLGYPSSEKDVTSRLNKILSSASDTIFVSVEDKTITGWIHVFAALRLESDSFAEICGLVVKEEFRNKGIGKELVKASEN